jgi:hypothetical protein
MRLPLLLLLGDSAGILLAQSSADGAGLFRSQIEREILLLLVEEPQLVALVGVDDGQSAGDGFAEIVSRYSRVSASPFCAFLSSISVRGVCQRTFS